MGPVLSILNGSQCHVIIMLTSEKRPRLREAKSLALSHTEIRGRMQPRLSDTVITLKALRPIMIKDDI